MEQFHFLDRILHNLSTHPGRKAFFICETWYTYGELSTLIAQIQPLVIKSVREKEHVGVYLADDIHTYASILALWMSGCAFIPINPQFPVARNRNIMKQLDLELILHSRELDLNQLDPACNTVFTGNLGFHSEKIPVITGFNRKKDAYVLFTSGSTGNPKGVRISVNNLNAFVRDFIGYPAYSFTHEDRFLQIYDLSFDGSIPCYVVPLAVGACIYTVPLDGIKYLAAYKLMQDHKLTFVKMPPSTLSYLRPYFSSIRLPDPKYCLLGGEAFPSMLAKEWEKCVPNALIQNVYGPTEASIISLMYDWKKSRNSLKEYRGIVSIGRVFGSNIALVMKDNGELALTGETGELLIAGDQVSPGYWGDPALNESAFLELDYDEKPYRFYRTGDIVNVDDDGDVMYIGRNDEQVQVRGYRVELGEIESLARAYLGGESVIAAGKDTGAGEMKIYLLIESEDVDINPLRDHLRQHLPSYMIPEQIITIPVFPRLVSGKLDRKALNGLLR
ncbi:MAG: AMP-binding protein [Bacteroidales bacterium]|nr:AMP-binding protein [Bacteroidales bacterium]